MKRIDTATAESDTHGTGKDGFTDGDPGITPRTIVDEDWCNGVQEEALGPVEALGITPDGSNLHQLQRALEIRDMLGTLAGTWRESALGSSISGGLKAIACIDNFGQDPVSPNYRLAVVVGNDTVFYNLHGGEEPSATPQWVDLEGGTEDFQAAAGYPAGGAIVAVGLAGEWHRITPTSQTSGTISGTPDLETVFWDDVNSLWWACGPGGVYKAADAGSLSWTQVSAVDHEHGAVLDSGRVAFWRPGDDTLYYTDSPHTSLSAGILLSSTSGSVELVSDPTVGLVIVRGLLGEAGATS